MRGANRQRGRLIRRKLFIQAARSAVHLIEAAAVLVVTIWRRFGVWLLLGLEFALAADIITSVISLTASNTLLPSPRH